MKNKAILLVIATCFVSVSCTNNETEKKAALSKIITENFIWKDSVINYTLDSSCLTLTFPNTPEFTGWNFEFWVHKKVAADGRSDIHNTHWANRCYELENNQIKIDSLDFKGINSDSLEITLEIIPCNIIMGYRRAPFDVMLPYSKTNDSKLHFFNFRRFVSFPQNGGRVLTGFMNKGEQYTLINLNCLDSMKNEELKVYCKEEVEKFVKKNGAN